MRLWVHGIAAAVAIALGGTAHAHPQIDEARERFHAAEFETALAALSLAEASEDLTRDEVIQLLVLRMRVHSALGRVDAVRTDAERLLSLEPTHTTEREDPPNVRRALTEASAAGPEGLRVDVDAEIEPGRLTLRAETHNDRGDLVTMTRLHVRMPNQEWQAASGSRFTSILPGGGTVDYYAQALGPGSAPLAWAGTPTEPLAAEIPPSAQPDQARPEIIPAEDERPIDEIDERRRWPWWVAGAAVVVAGTVLALGLTLRGGESDATRITNISWEAAQ